MSAAKQAVENLSCCYQPTPSRSVNAGLKHFYEILMTRKSLGCMVKKFRKMIVIRLPGGCLKRTGKIKRRTKYSTLTQRLKIQDRRFAATSGSKLPLMKRLFPVKTASGHKPFNVPGTLLSMSRPRCWYTHITRLLVNATDGTTAKCTCTTPSVNER